MALTARNISVHTAKQDENQKYRLVGYSQNQPKRKPKKMQ